MNPRFWFYLLFGIIIVALFSYWAGERNGIQKTLIQQEQQSLNDRHESIKTYAAKQTDARKLVSYAKNISSADSKSLQIIIDRAYELEPNSRDIVILASEFHPELKKRIQELDPLYEEKNN
jgi:hypothetical protein